MDHTSSKVTLLIPVRKGGRHLIKCISSVLAGTAVPQIIVLDCTAAEGAMEEVRSRFPAVRIIRFGMNPGRAHAVNTGFHISQTPYVMTLSPQILIGKHCVEKLRAALDEDSSLFSAQGKILSAEDPSVIAGAGWSLDLTARPFLRGEGRKVQDLKRRARITASQMRCAIYRMEYLEAAGILDERYYARLEDLDLGVRAGLCGFGNLFEPAAAAKEMEKEPVTEFYSTLETGNLVYFKYKFGIRDIRLPFVKADPAVQAALERGAMLCFQAEMEMMERQEMGMTVTKLTLPDEFCMEIREDGPAGVYPLCVGERMQYSLQDLPDILKTFSGMIPGTLERVPDLRRLSEKIRYLR